MYLIDEPSAYLDSEQRIAAARVIKRYECISAFSARAELTVPLARVPVLQVRADGQGGRVCGGARHHHVNLPRGQGTLLLS